ncbi:DUF2199 domain-containing protein [Streptomyces stackebrandtii]|uniref:DUF2199 domain-containing protein n=1 Tax=Streptomyces stackebrandtii TaxID=3051177 RepID=UPI0028DC5022|nr:DUF2199 domain-containing protein [Streptomyces sp. DSM 40976]
MPVCSPTTLNLKTNVHTRPIGERPYVEVEPTDHPLTVEQRTGIIQDRVRAILPPCSTPSATADKREGGLPSAADPAGAGRPEPLRRSIATWAFHDRWGGIALPPAPAYERGPRILGPDAPERTAAEGRLIPAGD